MLRTLGSDVIPPPNVDVLVEDIADVPGADDLRRIALRRVRRPHVEVVTELRRQEPAGERQEELLQLRVLAPLHRVDVPECIRVGFVEAQLIEIARVAEKADVHLAEVVLDDQKSAVRDVTRRLLRRLWRRPGGSGAATRKSATQPSDTHTPLSS